jgi:hypothetical protein
MKTRYTIAAAIIIGSLSSAAAADFYSQNFDSMGTTGTTPPAGWSVFIINGSSSSLTIPTSAEMATATLGTTVPLVVWNQTQASAEWDTQAGNMGSTATAPNRLLGTSPTSTRGSILQLSLTNTFGAAISSISVAYDMTAMANGTLKPGFTDTHEELPGYSFYYLDGSTWTHVANLDLANDTLNSVGHASTVIHPSTPFANGGTMQFRWFDDNSNAFSPDFMFAIDNVVVNVPEPATLSLLAVGSLALISRRRKA